MDVLVIQYGPLKKNYLHYYDHVILQRVKDYGHTYYIFFEQQLQISFILQMDFFDSDPIKCPSDDQDPSSILLLPITLIGLARLRVFTNRLLTGRSCNYSGIFGKGVVFFCLKLFEF